MSQRETRPGLRGLNGAGQDDQPTTPISPEGTGFVYCASTWLRRAEGHWRDQIDLSTCDTITAYAAGRQDGYELAMTEVKGWAVLLLAELEAATP